MSFGGVVGGTLNDDYKTFRYPITFLQNGSPVAGFSQFASGPRHFLAGILVEAGITRHFAIEGNALWRPVSYRNSFVLENGSALGSPDAIRTASWEFPILAKYRLPLPLAPFVESGVSLRPAGNGSNLSHAGFTAGAGVEVTAHRVRIAPTIRYTRWAQYSTGPFQARQDQLELMVKIYQPAESWAPMVFGRRVSLGGVVGVALGDNVRAARQFFSRVPDSNTAIVGAMAEANVANRFSVEVDGIYRAMHWSEQGPGNSVRQALLTWEFPVLAKYKLPARVVSPIVEAGPSFRASGNLNGARPKWYGVTAGAGVETRLRGLKISPVIRYTRWGRDGSSGDGPPQTLPNRVELLVGLSF